MSATKRVLEALKSLVGTNTANRAPYADLQALEVGLRLDAYEPRCSWPSLYYETTKKLVEWVQAKEVLEIGIAFGYHAKALMDAKSLPSYTGIDPYLAGYDPNDFFVDEVHRIFNAESPQKSMDLLFKEVEGNLSSYGKGNAEVFRGTTEEFRTKSLQKKFDFIWIDGDHTFEGVLRDLEFSLSAVNSGGIIAGDDFQWPQVQNAVAKFASDHELAPFEVKNLNQGGHSIFVFLCEFA